MTDKLTEMLADGWVVAGYSNTIMAAGAMTYSILLQKGTELVATTIVVSQEKEQGRIFVPIAPAPEQKKGFW